MNKETGTWKWNSNHKRDFASLPMPFGQAVTSLPDRTPVPQLPHYTTQSAKGITPTAPPPLQFAVVPEQH